MDKRNRRIGLLIGKVDKNRISFAFMFISSSQARLFPDPFSIVLDEVQSDMGILNGLPLRLEKDRLRDTNRSRINR